MRFRTLENTIKDVVLNKIKNGISYVSLTSTIRKLYEYKQNKVEVDQKDQIAAGTYRTKHFEMSPDAQKLLSNMQKKPTFDFGSLEKMTIELDKLFGIHKTAKAKGFASETELRDAEDYAKRAKLFASNVKLESEIGFINDTLRMLRDLNQRDKFNTQQFPTATPTTGTKEKPDRDIDNQKLPVSRSLAGQRKIKIIDDD